MTHEERQLIEQVLKELTFLKTVDAAIAVKLLKLENQQVNIANAINSLHHRLTVQEAGTAMYEVEHPEGRIIN